MKLLYVANTYDPLRHSDGSGTDYDLYQAFLANGLEVEIVGPFNYPLTFPERVFRRFHRVLSKRRPAKQTGSYLQRSARQVEEAIARYRPDILFTFFSAPLVRADFEIPLIYMIDTTLIGQQAQWPLFSKLAFSQMLNAERKLIEKSSKIITLSKWSAEILVNDYQVPPEKISFLPIPASIPEEKVPDQIEIEKPLADQVNILMVGRNYRRKGVDIAIEAVSLLIQIGIPAVLRIVGLEGTDTEHVKYLGSFNKTIPEELEAYLDQYRWAHFLIHPARFEAAGIVPGEAAAFGVPTITNAAGGLATTVEDGVSGVVLPRHSPAEKYAQVIEKYIQNPEAYDRLRFATRKRYDRYLNWSKAGKTIVGIIREVYQEMTA